MAAALRTRSADRTHPGLRSGPVPARAVGPRSGSTFGTPIVLLLALILVAPVPALAQDDPGAAGPDPRARADEILAEALDRYRQSLDGVEAVQMEILQMGMPTRMRMEVVREPSGVVRLRPVSVTMMGTQVDAADADFPGGVGIYETPLEDLAGMYRYEGRVEVDGRTAHRLSFTDPDPSGMSEELMNDEGIEFLDGTGAMLLDVETLDLLRMEWSGRVRHAGEPQTMMMRIDSEGFGEVDGYRYPARTRIETDAARFTMTDEDRALLRGQLDQIRASIPAGQVPEGEMGEMMAALLEQADQLESMLDDGVMVMELEMRDVQVERQGEDR